MTPAQLDALISVEQWMHRDPSAPQLSTNPAADLAELAALRPNG